MGSRTRAPKVWEHFTLNTAKKWTMCNIFKVDVVWDGGMSVLNPFVHLKGRHVGLLNVDDAYSELHR